MKQWDGVEEPTIIEDVLPSNNRIELFGYSRLFLGRSVSSENDRKIAEKNRRLNGL